MPGLTHFEYAFRQDVSRMPVSKCSKRRFSVANKKKILEECYDHILNLLKKWNKSSRNFFELSNLTSFLTLIEFDEFCKWCHSMKTRRI